VPFKKVADSLVMRVPWAIRCQSLLIIFPVSTIVQRLRFICSKTDLPLKGKSSIVISGENPLECARIDTNPAGTMFFSSK